MPPHFSFASPRVLGFTAIALAAICWAIGANIASELFRLGIPPLELAEGRAVIAAIGLGCLNGLRSHTKPWYKHFAINRWVFVLGLTLALVNLTYYLAIAHLTVAVALVVQYTAPAFVVLWMALRDRRSPSLLVSSAVITAMVGVALIVELSGHDMHQLNGAGLGFAILSAVLFAAYTLLAEKAGTTQDAVNTMFKGFVIASLFWIAVQLPQGWPMSLFQPTLVLGILLVGIVGTLMPFLLYCWGVQRVQADRAAIAATLEPVIAAAIAWVWLDQTLSSLQILGGGLVICAIIVLQFQRTPPTTNLP